jgi:ATP-binding cassette subfamily B protein
MVVIAHRLSTIRHADLIYVIDAGRVVQVGLHNDLVATVGIYQNLWNVQTGERLTADG